MDQLALINFQILEEVKKIVSILEDKKKIEELEKENKKLKIENELKIENALKNQFPNLTEITSEIITKKRTRKQ